MIKEPIYVRHPELFHYTTFGGLEGILKSQTLWATHYRYLNDTTETKLVLQELVQEFEPRLKDHLHDVRKHAKFSQKRRAKRLGNLKEVAREEARHLAEEWYNIAYSDMESGPPIAVPFITSFCSHSADQEYERKNGLLSQWRGYSEDGFAIVFNTKRLCKLFEIEHSDYSYFASPLFDDVVYQNQRTIIDAEFSDVWERIWKEQLKYYYKQDYEILGFLDDFLKMTVRLKHRSFQEEREVRSAVFPLTDEAWAHYRNTYRVSRNLEKPLKPILHRQDQVPYIELFRRNTKRRLPITRIIVGPQANQIAAKERVLSLIGNRKIDVLCSETPLSRARV